MKLEKLIFIYQHIDASVSSSVHNKEIAVKAFLDKHDGYTFYEVCRAIKLNKGTYYNFIHNKVERKQNLIVDDKLKIEIKRIYDEMKGRIGTKRLKSNWKMADTKLQRKKCQSSLKKWGSR